MDAQRSAVDETEFAISAVKSLREEVRKVFDMHILVLEKSCEPNLGLGDYAGLKNGRSFTRANDSTCETAKVFSLRESPLTDLFKSTHIRTIYHICIASMALLVVNLAIEELINGGSVKPEVDLICWFFGKSSSMVATWILMFSSVVCFLYPGYRIWSRLPKSNGWPDCVGILAYLCWTSAFLYLPIHFIFLFDLPIGSSAFIVCEQVRFIMKAHSFIRENCLRSKEHMRQLCNRATDTNEKNVRNSCPTFGSFIYFLFAPTLIYRDKYPRRGYVRWSLVSKHFMEILGCIFYSQHLFVHFCMPLFKNFNRDEVSWSSFLLSSFGCVLPGVTSYLLAFYAVLHSWMNAFAEMLRFGDRMFYMDWWNCTTMSSFYRKWNCIVYDWLHAYVYLDLCALLGENGRTTAKVAVFFVSAVVHEYILTMSLRFFNPTLFVVFFFGAGPGVILLMRSTKDSKWNFCLWLMLMLGNGILFCAYCREWYARQNCICAYASPFDLLMPCSWTCSTASSDTKSIPDA